MTEKLTLKTKDLSEENYNALIKLFPSIVTETITGYDEDGNAIVKRAIDKDKLEQEINTRVLEGREERYQFTWPDKRKAMLEANAPINATLRPCREESVNFDTTENLYIEGDNLDVLKLLRETYLGKIKMIYIDPPYNTGKDFIYRDDFKESADDFLERDGQYDEQGDRLVTNLESNGRFHTDWLNMIYPRLKLAKDLLRDDGVIFISIDDNEVENLKKVCDEIFGEENFIAQMVRKRRNSQANLAKNISPIHEYVLLYTKNYGNVLNKVSANIDMNEYKNPDNDSRGPYKTMPCTNKGGTVYQITTPTNKKIIDEWRFKEETYNNMLKDNRIIFPKNGEGKPRYKLFLKDKIESGQLANTWLDNISSNQEATNEIKELLNNIIFDTPKPKDLIKYLLSLGTNSDSIILDFFSGSATTAHAVMQLNAEDGGKRQFIMVQLPEQCADGSEAKNAGYNTICDIGKERIRRAAKKITEEHPDAKFDGGFRVLKLDSSNMKEVYYKPEEYAKMNFDLSGLADNIKEDRTDEDLLFQVMLELGVPLSSKITEENGIYNVNDNYLLAYFGKTDDDILTKIAKAKPLYAVFRDSSFADNSAKANMEQIFKTYSDDTNIKVL